MCCATSAPGYPPEALPSSRLELPFSVRMRCSTSRFRGNGVAFNTEGRSDLWKNFAGILVRRVAIFASLAVVTTAACPSFSFPGSPGIIAIAGAGPNNRRTRWKYAARARDIATATNQCCRGGAPNIAALKAAAIKEGSRAHCTLQARVH